METELISIAQSKPTLSIPLNEKTMRSPGPCSCRAAGWWKTVEEEVTAGPDQTRFPALLLRSPEERFLVQQSAEPGTRLPTIPPGRGAEI